MLPSELQEKWGHLNGLRKRGVSEWSSACPQCGDSGHVGNDDPDRFRMFAPEPGRGARGWCRSCNFFSFADNGKAPSPERMEQINRERGELVARERERISQKIERLKQAAYWHGWHDAMQENQRNLWKQQGIDNYFIDYYKLGYCPEYKFKHNDSHYTSPTMTIPHYDDDWLPVNIQHRIINPPPNVGKYRQLSGLPVTMFRTEPEQELTGRVVLVEGAKKAIVTYQHMGTKWQVVAVPSKSPPLAMLENLSNAEVVFLCLDPDAYTPTRAKDGRIIKPAVNRIVKNLTPPIKLVKLPCKPDDFFTMYGGKSSDMSNYLDCARSV